MSGPAQLWRDALTARAIVRAGRAAAVLRARAGPVRDAWLAGLGPVLRITPEGDAIAFGEQVDLIASMAAGRPVRRPGLVDRVGDRVLVIAGGERIDAAAAGALASAVDRGLLPRLVLLDEGEETGVPPMLEERIAMHLDLSPLSVRDLNEAPAVAGCGAAPSDVAAGFCEAAAVLGIGSARTPLHALAVARGAAAAAGRGEPEGTDVATAARLVLAPRAVAAPSAPEPAAEREAGSAEAEGGAADRELVLDAVRAALPPGVVDPGEAVRGRAGGSATARRGGSGRGAAGRVRRGIPGRAGRLDLVATLLAAAPFQRLRGRPPGARPALRRDDLRVRLREPVQRATTILAVDASGSAALARLAEVKGAVERLLAESYVRRDEVALVTFRGERAALLLPPTRSLARAKRELAALPGGGATPLAAGIAAGLEQALRARQAGRAVSLLVLTDGGANVARDGTRGRGPAQADAAAAARSVAAAGIAAVLVDASARGDPQLRALAAAMGARYMALPRCDADAVAAAAR